MINKEQDLNQLETNQEQSVEQNQTDEKCKPKPNFKRAKKYCRFCAIGQLRIDFIDDLEAIKRFLSPYAKINPRRITGNCNMHQRHVANALKRARYLALVPFIKD